MTGKTSDDHSNQSGGDTIPANQPRQGGRQMAHGFKRGRVTDVVDGALRYVQGACLCSSCAARRVERKRASRQAVGRQG